MTMYDPYTRKPIPSSLDRVRKMLDERDAPEAAQEDVPASAGPYHPPVLTFDEPEPAAPPRRIPNLIEQRRQAQAASSQAREQSMEDESKSSALGAVTGGRSALDEIPSGADLMKEYDTDPRFQTGREKSWGRAGTRLPTGRPEDWAGTSRPGDPATPSPAEKEPASPALSHGDPSLDGWRPKPVERKPVADAAALRAAGAAGRESARQLSIDADPEAVASSREKAMAAAEDLPAFDAPADVSERVERREMARDVADYNEKLAAYKADFNRWQMAYNDAIARGDDDAAIKLSQQQPKPPDRSLRMTGGLTEQEMQEPIHDTLDKLDIDDLRALVDHFKAYDGGMDDALSMQYADLPPAERLAAMKNDAARLRNASAQPMRVAASYTPGGAGAGRGDNARDEDLSKEDRRMMGRDVTFGQPVTKRGGTFVRDGSAWSSRAPSPTQMSAAGARGLNPEGEVAADGQVVMTDAWREQMKQAGVAMGLDPSGFDNEGAFIAATQDKLRLWQERESKGMRVLPVATGGYRYAPNAEHKKAAATRATQADVREFLKAHPYSTDPDTGEQSQDMQRRLQDAANTGDAKEVAALKQQIRQGKHLQTAGAVRDRNRMMGDQRNMMNPQLRPAMFRASLQQAQQDGPQAVALVYDQFGMPQLADQMRQRANEAVAAEGVSAKSKAELEALQAQGRGKEKDKPLPQEVNDQMVRHTVDQAFEDDVSPHHAISNYRIAHNSSATATGSKPLTSDQEAAEGLAREMLFRNPMVAFSKPVVQIALQGIFAPLWSNRLPFTGTHKEAFMAAAKSKLGNGPGMDKLLSDWYDRMSPPAAGSTQSGIRPPASAAGAGV